MQSSYKPLARPVYCRGGASLGLALHHACPHCSCTVLQKQDENCPLVMVHSKQSVQTGGHEMMLTLSRAEARRFLATYHFTPTDVPGVFARLGTVQYDPLNPVGRNPDLVLQARVPGYQVDDWQKTAYTDRIVYDAWDKMACLVPMSDCPMRAVPREMYRPYHDREFPQAEPP